MDVEETPPPFQQIIPFPQENNILSPLEKTIQVVGLDVFLPSASIVHVIGINTFFQKQLLQKNLLTAQVSNKIYQLILTNDCNDRQLLCQFLKIQNNFPATHQVEFLEFFIKLRKPLKTDQLFELIQFDAKVNFKRAYAVATKLEGSWTHTYGLTLLALSTPSKALTLAEEAIKTFKITAKENCDDFLYQKRAIGNLLCIAEQNVCSHFQRTISIVKSLLIFNGDTPDEMFFTITKWLIEKDYYAAREAATALNAPYIKWLVDFEIDALTSTQSAAARLLSRLRTLDQNDGEIFKQFAHPEVIKRLKEVLDASALEEFLLSVSNALVEEKHYFIDLKKELIFNQLKQSLGDEVKTSEMYAKAFSFTNELTNEGMLDFAHPLMEEAWAIDIFLYDLITILSPVNYTIALPLITTMAEKSMKILAIHHVVEILGNQNNKKIAIEICKMAKDFILNDPGKDFEFFLLIANEMINLGYLPEEAFDGYEQFDDSDPTLKFAALLANNQFKEALQFAASGEDYAGYRVMDLAKRMPEISQVEIRQLLEAVLKANIDPNEKISVLIDFIPLIHEKLID
jgi:hypothetical protein